MQTVPPEEITDRLGDMRKRAPTLNDVSYLPSISIVLGGRRTRLELIPFLRHVLFESVLEDEPQHSDVREAFCSCATLYPNIAVAVAESCVSWTVEGHLDALFDLLVPLALQPEKEVQEAALRSLADSIALSETKTCVELVLNLNSHPNPRGGIVLAKLMSALVEKVGSRPDLFMPSSMEDLKCQVTEYMTATQTDVRSATAAELLPIIAAFHTYDPSVVSAATGWIKTVVQDTHDAIRLRGIPLALGFLALLPKEESRLYMPPIWSSILPLAADHGWLTRLTFAENFSKILCAFQSSCFLSGSLVLSLYVPLLVDSLDDVRQVALEQAPGVLTALLSKQSDVSVLLSMQSHIAKLLQDSSADIRTSVFRIGLELVSLYSESQHSSKDQLMKGLVLHVCAPALQDPDPFVLRECLVHLTRVDQTLCFPALSVATSTALLTLMQEEGWRDVCVALQVAPDLCQIVYHQASSSDLYATISQVLALTVKLVAHAAFAVRVSAATHLPRLVRGPLRARMGHLWPLITALCDGDTEMVDSTEPLLTTIAPVHRIKSATILLLENLPEELEARQLLVRLATDTAVCVRAAAGRTASTWVETPEPEAAETASHVLRTLRQDSDPCVCESAT
ncbi:MAG: hypothetical protein KVP17_004275 [Porospora cf. gigantea B]|uniref:uncharacterized protein n=1 Tax=Porospora cf. gigantea B TaxID=2853592 RepID=UPI003571D5C9|nr:MAG: hypothetical protein KVP17_004275 [Porospora cf. gigantea B]